MPEPTYQEPTTDFTTLICLFHHQEQANAALQDILKAGVPESNVTLIGKQAGSNISGSMDTLAELNVPEKDLKHLQYGLDAGGAVLSVSAISSLADKVDSIFKSHKADKIDEATVADDMSGIDTLDPLAASAVEEDFLLVPSATGNEVYVYRVQPLEGAATEDTDPRELGLDSRMAPVKTDADY